MHISVLTGSHEISSFKNALFEAYKLSFFLFSLFFSFSPSLSSRVRIGNGGIIKACTVKSLTKEIVVRIFL